VLAAWGLNRINEYLGYVLVSLYACVSIGIRFRLYRRVSARLKKRSTLQLTALPKVSGTQYVAEYNEVAA
jgi:hypothetical protein